MLVRKRREGGESATEFAVMVMAILLMFLGMLQIGSFLWASAMVENAANYGARAGSVAQSGGAGIARSAALESLSGAPLISNPSVQILAPGGVVGSMVKIRVSAEIPLFMPAGDTFGLDALTQVKAEATFRQEGW